MKRPKPGSALAAPILKAPPPEKFDVGERVECKVRCFVVSSLTELTLQKTMNWTSWYPGLVEKRNSDGTWVVQFDDGERLFDIKMGEIRRLITVRVNRKDSGDESSDDDDE